jgi:hypothetical protein
MNTSVESIPLDFFNYPKELLIHWRWWTDGISPNSKMVWWQTTLSKSLGDLCQNLSSKRYEHLTLGTHMQAPLSPSLPFSCCHPNLLILQQRLTEPSPSMGRIQDHEASALSWGASWSSHSYRDPLLTGWSPIPLSLPNPISLSSWYNPAQTQQEVQTPKHEILKK